jgi:LacI family transcriptional regulator
MDGDLWFTDTVIGLGEAASRLGYSVIYAWAGRDHAAERAHIETLLERRVDGLVLVSTSETRPQKHLADLHRDGVRLVTVNRYGAEGGFRRIFFDWRGGTNALTRKVMRHGHRRIAFVGGTPDHPKAAVREQIAGYRAALQEAGTWIPEAEAFGGGDAEAGEALTEALFARCPAVTALVTVNDHTAAGALRALRRLGRHVPDDVAVIGCDDLYIARCKDPPLTSVRHQALQAGELACRLLVSEIDGTPEPQLTYLLPSSLVIRGSCGLPHHSADGSIQLLV